MFTEQLVVMMCTADTESVKDRMHVFEGLQLASESAGISASAACRALLCKPIVQLFVPHSCRV